MKRAPKPRSVLAILSSIVTLVLICPPVYGQCAKIPSAIPRGPDGKPNLSAPAPRWPDGHLDLSGIWELGGGKDSQDIPADLILSALPFQPWARPPMAP